MESIQSLSKPIPEAGGLLLKPWGTLSYIINLTRVPNSLLTPHFHLLQAQEIRWAPTHCSPGSLSTSSLVLV